MNTRVHPGDLLAATVDVGPHVDHGVALLGSSDVGHSENSEEEETLVLEESNGVRPSNDPDLYPIGARHPPATLLIGPDPNSSETVLFVIKITLPYSSTYTSSRHTHDIVRHDHAISLEHSFF